MLDQDALRADELFGTSFGMNKAQRLDYGESLMTHAMVFQGVNLDENGKPDRWRVENSWGPDAGAGGYYVMSDNTRSRVGGGGQEVPHRRAARGAGPGAHRPGALGPHGVSGLRRTPAPRRRGRGEKERQE